MKKVYLGVIILIVITIALVLKLTSSDKDESLNTPVAKKKVLATSTKTAVTLELIDYKDPSGFMFKLPENLKVKREESTNDSIYSSLSIAAPQNPGGITIRAESSSLNAVDDWFLTNKTFLSKEKIDKLKLADLDARQFESEGKLVTVALDQGALFTITTDYKSKKDFWSEVHEQITSSFAFQQPSNSTSSDSAVESSGDDVFFEGEEIIE